MKNLFLFIVGIGLAHSSMAQDTTLQARFRIMTTPTEFIGLNFPLTIEKIVGRHAFALTLAYRPSTQSSGEVQGGKGSMGGYDIQNFTNYLYNAVTIGIGTKYYIPQWYNFFFETDVFYRHWWFDDKYASYPNVEGYRFNGRRTESQNVYGIKLLGGRSFEIKSNSRIKFVVDIYAGLGLRYRTHVYETFDGTVNDTYYLYLKETGNDFYPTPQFGLKVGMGI